MEKHGNASLNPQENIDASFKYIKKTTHDQAVAKDVCNSEPNSSETPKSSIKPEGVPPNEPWLIEVDGQKAIGARYQGDAFAPWAVAALDGSFLVGNSDNEITLIHKLVPETHTLPEGMRLADHETFGRIIVSPREDSDGDHLAFFPDESTRSGSDWIYLQKSEFTYMDGETK